MKFPVFLKKSNLQVKVSKLKHISSYFRLTRIQVQILFSMGLPKKFSSAAFRTPPGRSGAFGSLPKAIPQNKRKEARGRSNAPKRFWRGQGKRFGNNGVENKPEKFKQDYDFNR